MKRLSRRTMMKMVAATPLAACGGVGSSGSPPPLSAESTNASQALRSITCDVCVMGAGASGMYATMRLREAGHSVTLLERSDRVGGHANTYRDPQGRGAQEMGVRIYPAVPIIKDTFDRYGVALKKIDLAALQRKYIDIRTGEQSTYQDPNPLQTFASLTQYGLLLRTQYAYISKEGYQLPTPVPDELLQPFAQFLRDRNLNEGYAPVTHYLQGYGPVRKIPALYALKNMRPDISEAILFGNFVAPVNGCSTLYDTWAQQLGNNLVLGANVSRVLRDGAGVMIDASTPGQPIQVRAKKLIVSFPPLLKALASFDLDDQERDLFAKMKTSYYWTTLVQAQGLPADTVLFNVAGNNVLEGQQFPGMYTAVPTPIPDTWNVLYGSETDMTDDDVKAHITDDLQRMSGRFVPGTVTVHDFPKFLNHAAFGITVDVDDIKSGYYNRLWARQGQRDTFFIGAGVDTNDTSSVWTHAEKIVSENFAKVR